MDEIERNRAEKEIFMEEQRIQQEQEIKAIEEENQRIIEEE